MSNEKKREEIAEYSERVMGVIKAEGEVDKIRQLMTRLVTDSNWRDAVKRMSSKKMDQELVDDLTPESVTEMIMEEAISALPKSIQSAVDKHIRDVLTRKKVPAEQASQKK